MFKALSRGSPVVGGFASWRCRATSATAGCTFFGGLARLSSRPRVGTSERLSDWKSREWRQQADILPTDVEHLTVDEDLPRVRMPRLGANELVSRAEKVDGQDARMESGRVQPDDVGTERVRLTSSHASLSIWREGVVPIRPGKPHAAWMIAGWGHFLCPHWFPHHVSTILLFKIQHVNPAPPWATSRAILKTVGDEVCCRLRLLKRRVPVCSRNINVVPNAWLSSDGTASMPVRIGSNRIARSASGNGRKPGGIRFRSAPTRRASRR